MWLLVELVLATYIPTYILSCAQKCVPKRFLNQALLFTFHVNPWFDSVALLGYYCSSEELYLLGAIQTSAA